jgi:predicted dehydrogenase
MLRVGVIGLGVMGKNHVRVLSSLEGVQLVAVVDKYIDKSSIALNVPIFNTIEELINIGVDYCVVAVPTELHEEVAIKLAENKIHALIEKPLSINKESSLRIISSFNANGVIGAVGHIERYNSALVEAYKRIKDGEIGEIYQIATRRQGPFPTRIADVGVVKDLLTHDIDLTLWLSGSEYESISAYTASKSESLHEDLVSVSGKMKNGIVVSHIVNWLSPQKERKTIITGEKGSLVIDTLMSTITMIENGNFHLDWNDLANFNGVTEGNIIQYSIKNKEPLKSEHESFRDYLNNLDSLIVTLEEAAKNVLVAEVILKSAEDGCSYKI